MSAHLFIDYSDIFIGAHKMQEISEPNVHSTAFWLHDSNLLRLLEGGKTLETRVLAGLVPPSCGKLGDYARNRGYNFDFLHSVVTEDMALREQEIDETVRELSPEFPPRRKGSWSR